MSKEIIDKAKEYLEAQLSVIPINKDKLPAISTWKPYQSQRMKEEDVESLFNGANVKGLAIICGAISENLEVIDVDIKYDVTGELWINFKNLIRLEDSLSDLLNDLLIAKTVNNGYHIFYKCDETEGNQKLAFNVEGKCIIETRGEGGYVVAYPSFGYEFIQGSVEDIPTITPFQRKKLFEIADSLSYSEPTIGEDEVVMGEAITGLSCWDDFNNRATIETVLTLLKAHNWSEVKTDKDGRVYVLRPTNDEPSTAKYSGNISRIKKGDREICLFSVFTDNGAPFTENVMRDGKPVKDEKGRFKKQAYTPFKVYALLEHNGDSSKAAKELYKLGYGERITKPDSQVKTELIKVELVNSVNKETSVISNPGELLKIEDVENSTGGEVVITSPGGTEAQEEVLKVIEKLFRAGKRIYIKEGSNELREYKYILNTIFNKYGAIQEHTGGLTDRDTDSLLDEVVILASKLQPIDKDQFLKSFISLEDIKELGISEESLSITVDRLTSTRDKEAQAKEFKNLLSEANRLQDKGETDKALELVNSKVKEVILVGAKDLLSPPMNFTTLLDEIATLPPAYKTGYSSLDSFIGFTPGAISLIAGRPSHGKTTFMFNLLLQMSNLYQDESFYFFTYEEPVKNISVKLLNRLIDTDLSGYFREIKDLPKPTNYEFIKSYIRARRTDINSVEEGKRQLQELIDNQRIKVIDRNYSVEQLSSLIAYLNKRERIGALFIDYIQRMNTERKTQDKRTEIAHISDSVLQIAKESGLPIILGAQLNRATDTKGGKPKLENLKEAGNLEEDANTVISVYCKAREQEETESGEQSSKQREVELEIKTLKNREGEVNTKETLKWDRWTGVIKDQSTIISHF